MIDIIFYFGADYIMVRVRDKTVTFAISVQGAMEAPIEGLQLNYSGVCREFPDLTDKDDWREQAIKRFNI